MKDKISWFGEKGNDGIEVVKTAGKAIGISLGLVVVGVALGAVGHAFGGGGK
jgi:hypothetical protein